MKTDELLTIRSHTHLDYLANHYVVYMSLRVAAEDCMKSSCTFSQMRKTIYVPVENNVCKQHMIDNDIGRAIHAN